VSVKALRLPEPLPLKENVNGIWDARAVFEGLGTSTTAAMTSNTQAGRCILPDTAAHNFISMIFPP
jgi:hypothetical protein